jgi:hypothetical protein
MVVGTLIIGSVLLGNLFLYIINSSVNIPDTSGDEFVYIPPSNDNNSIVNEHENKTIPSLKGNISIEGVGTFFFEPSEIDTVRPDLFKPNYFSLFDILVYLDRTKQINMDYSVNKSMNTHVIHSIDGIDNWWYEAYYSGGWWEKNVFRMDHFPYKDGTKIDMVFRNPVTVENIHLTFMEEVERKNNNNGSIIIPTVTIHGPPGEGTIVFTNVHVTPHNLRTDVFREGVVTAIDTILSLVDQGEIQTELQWYESINNAEVVKSYWVESINNWIAYYRCGFVYEAGDSTYYWDQGNHIHIPSDSLIINSPEYVEYAWICV